MTDSASNLLIAGDNPIVGAAIEQTAPAFIHAAVSVLREEALIDFAFLRTHGHGGGRWHSASESQFKKRSVFIHREAQTLQTARSRNGRKTNRATLLVDTVE
jgi:hypothetical protein